MNNNHICKYCGKVFEKGQSLGAHIICCEKNPKSYNDIFIQRRLDRKNSINPVKEYTLKCKVCNNEYKLKLHKIDFEKSNYKKCCSRNCSSKLTALHTDLENKNKNISKSLTNKIKKIKKRNCSYCGKEFILENNSKTIFCSEECRNKYKHEKLSKLALKNNFGGYKENSIKKHHKGNYKGIHCDSSWELAFVIWCKEHNINIKRCNIYRNYIYEGKIRKYYPDFIINNNEIIEIKGYFSEESKIKAEQNKDIKVLLYKDLKEVLDYSVNKYGKKFWETLYE